MFRLRQSVIKPTFINWASSRRGLKKVVEEKVSFFITPQGRGLSFILLSTATVVATNLKYIGPNGYLIDHVKEIYQRYTSDKPTQVSLGLQKLINECMEDLALSDQEKLLTKFIIGNVNEQPKTFGYTHGHDGRVLVILPYFFNHESEENLDKQSVLEVNPNVSKLSENSNEYKQFRNTLMLSDEAKKFAIARELQRGSKGGYRLEAYLGVLSVCTNYILCRTTNNSLRLLHGSFYRRLSSYVAFGLAHCLFFVYSANLLKISGDKELDGATARISKSYARGGAEFYLRETARHLCIRQYVKRDEYDKYGDKVNVFLDHLPLKDRAAACQHIAALHDADLT